MMSTKSSVAQRWLPRAGLLSAAFTTLCCLGISAALSLATAVGASFLTSDATLQPLLILTLAVTVLGSALTFRRHRNPAPLALTVLASALAYLAVFGPLQSAWVGLAALIAAQLWDAVRVRRCSAVQHPTPKGAL